MSVDYLITHRKYYLVLIVWAKCNSLRNILIVDFILCQEYNDISAIAFYKNILQIVIKQTHNNR